MSQVKVIKKVDREQLLVVQEKSRGTICADELLRRFDEFRRSYLALEKVVQTIKLDLKSDG